MTMNSGPVFVLQERDRHLLRELGHVRIFDRQQAQLIGGFGSESRTTRRLRQMVNAGLVRRMFLGTVGGGAKALYSLSEQGARVAGVPYRSFRRTPNQGLVGDFFVTHQLALNDVYCALRYQKAPLVPRVEFKRWLSFQEPVQPGLRLIPDGYVEFQTPAETVASFVEVDLGHERLKVWKQKVENYLQLALSGTFERQFGARRFRVLVVAHTPGRMLSIRKAVAAVTDKIFWFSNFEAIRRDGAFGSVWLRPRQNQPQPLFQELS